MSNRTVITVAQDLTAIVDLYADVLAQALHKASAQIDGHSLPGGAAMVNLAGVADGEINERRVLLQEQAHLATCTRLDHTRCWTGSEDEDDSEPILQTLLFWSEQWRAQHGYPLEGRRPTVSTEANVIRAMLDWAWDNLAEWDDFAKDIAEAKMRLENLLYAGRRPAFTGAPCMYDGASLVRKTVPTRDKRGQKVWVLSDWQCPKCRRRWDEDAYARNLHAAQESLHFRNIADETWWSEERAAERVGRSPSTVRSWVHRLQVRVACSVVDGRVFVYLPDVLTRHALAVARAERRKAAMVAKRTTAA